MIAPFWSDVDITNATNGLPTPGGTSTGSNRIYYDLDTVNRAFTVTWDDVAPFDVASDPKNAFQLRLVSRAGHDEAPGSFDIFFRYEAINWSRGGLARAGVSLGNARYSELPQSGNDAQLLQLEVNQGNTGSNGYYEYSVIMGTDLDDYLANERDGESFIDGGAGRDEIYGSIGNDRLFGGPGNDSLTGWFGNDQLFGGAGDDRFFGDAGADRMEGGSGRDSYFVDDPTDVVVETLAVDPGDLVIANFNFSLAGLPFVENLSLSVGATNGTGNALANTLRGNASANTLSGLGENDLLFGDQGDDILFGGDGEDVIHGEAGDDQLFGEAGNDQLFGGENNDELFGGAGADRMEGGDGADTYHVDNPGDVVFETLNQGDIVIAQLDYSLEGSPFLAHLTLAQFSGATVGTGNDSSNRLTGNELDNTLTGLGADDILIGGDGHDLLIGGEGNDTLMGEGGNDTLVGGSGSGTMDGGPGDDTFEFTNEAFSNAPTVIGGTNSSAGDNIRISDTANLFDPAFRNVSGVENLVLSNGGNLTLGSESQDAGITLVISFNRLDVTTTGRSGLEIIGSGSNDEFRSGSGFDTFRGGGGTDTYFVTSTSDVVDDAGNDIVFASVGYGLGGSASGVRRLTLEGNAISGTGNAEDNEIIGNSLNNELNGLTGNDDLDGGIGQDTMDGASGRDTYHVDDAGDKVNDNSEIGNGDEIFARVNYDLEDPDSMLDSWRN